MKQYRMFFFDRSIVKIYCEGIANDIDMRFFASCSQKMNILFGINHIYIRPFVISKIRLLSRRLFSRKNENIHNVLEIRNPKVTVIIKICEMIQKQQFITVKLISMTRKYDHWLSHSCPKRRAGL